MGFKINRVYTRKGDKGKTSLVSGESVSKANVRVASYGELDELNCFLGLVLASSDPQTVEVRDDLQLIQQELFDIGAELATAPDKIHKDQWRVGMASIERLENRCDSLSQTLPELDSFVLPGGGELSSRLHLARAVCRRAERAVVALSEHEEVSDDIISYLNRLSDYLFILSLWVISKDSKEPLLWIPGSKR